MRARQPAARGACRRACSGGSVAQRAALVASGQRGEKAQPGGSCARRRHACPRSRPSRAALRAEPRAARAAARACRDGAAARRARARRACSTIRPAYITATRSRDLRDDAEVVRDQQHRHAELALQRPRAARGSAPGSSRRARWSARRRSAAAGSQASAIAIITRWRMPPESSCGYCVRRAAPASGMPTRASSSTAARARRVAAEPAVQLERLADLVADPEHRVQRRHRLLEDHADLARRGRARSAASRSREQVAAVEAGSRRVDAPAASASRRRSESAVTDLPQPDSPTSASVSPAASARSTPRTAGTAPASVAKATRRSRTSSSGAGAHRARSAAAGSARRAGPRRPG